MFGLKKKRLPEPVLPVPTAACDICQREVPEERLVAHLGGHVRLVHRLERAEESGVPYRNDRRPCLAVYLVRCGDYAWSMQTQEVLARSVAYLHARHPSHADFQVVPQSYSNQCVSALLVFIRY